MMRLLWIAGFVSAFAIPLAARAYTVDQARACYPDAIRLCGAPLDWRQASLPQRALIVICMIAHQAELSPRCLKAFGK